MMTPSRSFPDSPRGGGRAAAGRCGRAAGGLGSRVSPRGRGAHRQHDHAKNRRRGVPARLSPGLRQRGQRPGPRDPGWGRAPPAPRGARSLSIRVCRLCVLTGPHLRPIGERRLEAITPQGADHGADRQSGCPRPRPQSQAPMPNANRAHRPQTTDHRLLFYSNLKFRTLTTPDT